MLCPVALMWSAMAEVLLFVARALKCSIKLKKFNVYHCCLCLIFDQTVTAVSGTPRTTAASASTRHMIVLLHDKN